MFIAINISLSDKITAYHATHEKVVPKSIPIIGSACAIFYLSVGLVWLGDTNSSGKL